MQQVLLIITNIFPISGATIKSAGSVIVSAMKMDLPPVCQPEKKVKAMPGIPALYCNILTISNYDIEIISINLIKALLF